MASMINSFSISGIDGYPVKIEANFLTSDKDLISIIGMGDTAIKEAGERVRSALTEEGYYIPKGKTLLSLAPADIRKRGSHYDLALALAILDNSNQIRALNMMKYGFLGELSLSGELRPVNGVLPMVLSAKASGIRHIIIPMGNYAEASLVSGIYVYGFYNLNEVIAFLEGRTDPPSYEESSYFHDQELPHEKPKLDFSDVRGQNSLIDAIVLAAAGGHNVLMIGTPGCGKTMIARRIPSILPRMTEEESLEVMKIHSIIGLLTPEATLLRDRPFRAPHHNASLNALIGGGRNATPGEVSLSHNGVLFLDEFGEFSGSTLDALRQPLEDKTVTVSRINGTNTYPANFMFVAAMNPCPCGFYPSKKCRCTDYEVLKYRNRISGPILDRIDIQKIVEPVDLFEQGHTSPGPTSEELREKVERARLIQQERFKDHPGIYCNAQMTGSMINRFCGLDEKSTDLLRKTCEKFGYSARVINKLLCMARTSADLAGSEKIRTEDISYVLHCRDLDKSNGSLLVI